MAFLFYVGAAACVFVDLFLGEHLLLGRVGLVELSWFLALLGFMAVAASPSWPRHRPGGGS